MNSESQLQKKSVLVVDDTPDVRLILNAILTQAGYSVTEAEDGQEALDILADRKFDLMILDLMMPRVTGEEVLDHLRDQDRLKEMPVIVLTAKGQQKEIERGYEKGASFYVVKPFNNFTIRELARYLIEDITEEEKEEILFKLMGSVLA